MENPSQQLNLLNKTNFGATIRELRKSQGLKAYELAEKVGIERTYITYIEKHNRLLSFFVMKKISDLLCKPELLRAYIKIKCSSFCDGQVMADEIFEQGIQNLSNSAPIRNSLYTGIKKEYLLSIKFKEEDAARKIFGNDLSCHGVLISFKGETKWPNSDSEIMWLDKFGILFILHGYSKQETLIPENCLMFFPWSDINYICPIITA